MPITLFKVRAGLPERIAQWVRCAGLQLAERQHLSDGYPSSVSKPLSFCCRRGDQCEQCESHRAVSSCGELVILLLGTGLLRSFRAGFT